MDTTEIVRSKYRMLDAGDLEYLPTDKNGGLALTRLDNERYGWVSRRLREWNSVERSLSIRGVIFYNTPGILLRGPIKNENDNKFNWLVGHAGKLQKTEALKGTSVFVMTFVTGYALYCFIPTETDMEQYNLAVKCFADVVDSIDEEKMAAYGIPADIPDEDPKAAAMAEPPVYGEIRQRVQNLKEYVAQTEKECENCRQALVKRAAESTAEEIVFGRLDNDITTLARQVEKLKSAREQISLLELLLKK